MRHRYRWPVLKLTVNGEPREVQEGTNLRALLAQMEVSPEHVAVEVNGEIVRRARYAEHSLATGDRVEIVTFVGGG